MLHLMVLVLIHLIVSYRAVALGVNKDEASTRAGNFYVGDVSIKYFPKLNIF